MIMALCQHAVSVRAPPAPPPYVIAAPDCRVKALQHWTVDHVAAGAHHSLFITRDGSVLGCGRGDEGQLGMEGQGLVTLPQHLPLPARDANQCWGEGACKY